MNASTSVPTTIQLRPTRLAGLLVAAAAVAAVVTWALLVFAVNQGTENAQRDISSSDAVLSSLTTQQRQYVEGVMALSPAELAATYGTGRGDVVSTLDPEIRRFVEGIASMSPEQIAAGYGNVLSTLDPQVRRFVEGSASMSPEQIAAGYGNVFPTVDSQQRGSEGTSLPSAEAITAVREQHGGKVIDPVELAATYGTGRGGVMFNPQERRFVQWLSSKSSAGSGNVFSTLDPPVLRYLGGIVSMSPEQIAAAYGNVFSAAGDPKAEAYIQGIMAATPEELVAAYGR
jgi:hypothetical protein